MVHAIVGRYVRNVERIDSLKTPHIEPVLLRIGSTLMMRIDTAVLAKVVTRGFCVELIEPQDISTLEYLDA